MPGQGSRGTQKQAAGPHVSEEEVPELFSGALKVQACGPHVGEEQVPELLPDGVVLVQNGRLLLAADLHRTRGRGEGEEEGVHSADTYNRGTYHEPKISHTAPSKSIHSVPVCKSGDLS